MTVASAAEDAYEPRLAGEMTETGCRSSGGCIDHNPLTRWQRIAYHMHVFRRSRATRLVSAPSARPGKLAQMPPYICFPGVGESGRRDGTSSRLHPIDEEGALAPPFTRSGSPFGAGYATPSPRPW